MQVSTALRLWLISTQSIFESKSSETIICSAQSNGRPHSSSLTSMYSAIDFRCDRALLVQRQHKIHSPNRLAFRANTETLCGATDRILLWNLKNSSFRLELQENLHCLVLCSTLINLATLCGAISATGDGSTQFIQYFSYIKAEFEKIPTYNRPPTRVSWPNKTKAKLTTFDVWNSQH